MRVNIVGLPHLEQGGRNVFDIFVLSAIRDPHLTRLAWRRLSRVWAAGFASSHLGPRQLQRSSFEILSLPVGQSHGLALLR